VGKPLGRYLQELRMREACRLLVETKRPIHEVARAVGFEDELCFSRRFRQEMRFAPREYQGVSNRPRATVRTAIRVMAVHVTVKSADQPTPDPGQRERCD